jgi:hypothetical protein
MSTSSKRPDEDGLPVTTEVGSEGGSPADPTLQVATRTGGLSRSDPPAAPAGEVAGAVAPSPDAAEDGVRAQRAGQSTGDYSATEAPENRGHVESEGPAGDPSRRPGGARGAPADVGMSGVDRDTLPNGGTDTGQTDYGTPAADRQGPERE